MTETMSRTPRASGRRAASTRAWLVGGLVLVLYAVAVGLVRLFDYVDQIAQLEQLREQGPLVRSVCGACAGLGAQVLSWMSDSRALLVFAVLLAVAAAGALVRGRTTGLEGRARRGCGKG